MLMVWGGAEVIVKIETKCTVNVMRLNHSETAPATCVWTPRAGPGLLPGPLEGAPATCVWTPRAGGLGSSLALSREPLRLACGHPGRVAWAPPWPSRGKPGLLTQCPHSWWLRVICGRAALSSSDAASLLKLAVPEFQLLGLLLCFWGISQLLG